MTANNMLSVNTSIDVLEQAKIVFSEGLSRSQNALKYLKRCGVSETTCFYHRLGVYDIKALSALLEFRDEDLVRAGLISSEETAEPLFVNSIMMPVYNSQLNTVGFLAQEVPVEGEISKPYTVVLHKGVDASALHFGIDLKGGNKDKATHIVSTPMEVLSLHSNGIENAVSPLEECITELFIDNVLTDSNCIHFVLPSIPDKASLAGQALSSSMRCVGRHRESRILFSFLPRPNRHCNAYFSKYDSKAFGDVLNKHRDIPELVYRKLGSSTASESGKDEILELANTEFADVNCPVTKELFCQKLISLAGHSDIEEPVDSVAAEEIIDEKVPDVPVTSVEPAIRNPAKPSKADKKEIPPKAGANTKPAIQQSDNAEAQVDAPSWVDQLLLSRVYEQQKHRSGRRAPKDPKVKIAIAVLDSKAGRMTISNLAASAGLSNMRARGFVGGLTTLLNVDGAKVLSIEEKSETVLLDISLLKSQFELN